MKLCGKKTPLLHRRKRRRKTLYHENGPEFEQSAKDADTVHVHPTAMKPNIVLSRSKYQAYKETRKKKHFEKTQKEPNSKKTQKSIRKNSPPSSFIFSFEEVCQKNKIKDVW